MEAKISRTCFTEIKLSMAKGHAHKYGNLGIGVTREFVIERYGHPVFYVTNGDHSNTVVCARKIRDFLEKTDKDILAEFEVLLGYFKKMGEQNLDDLDCYDELEWGVVHLDLLESEGRIIPQDKGGHIYRVMLRKEDVKVLVFPDEKTKCLALEDDDIRHRIENPICVTMKNCENF